MLRAEPGFIPIGVQYRRCSGDYATQRNARCNRIHAAIAIIARALHLIECEVSIFILFLFGTSVEALNIVAEDQCHFTDVFNAFPVRLNILL